MIVFKYDESYDNGAGQTEYSFELPVNTEADILIVGGGGGGGRYMGGGGGAGGLVLLQNYELDSNTIYNLAVGIGGDGNATTSRGHNRNGGKPGFDSYIKKSDNTNEIRGKGGGGGSVWAGKYMA